MSTARYDDCRGSLYNPERLEFGPPQERATPQSLSISRIEESVRKPVVCCARCRRVWKERFDVKISHTLSPDRQNLALRRELGLHTPRKSSKHIFLFVICSISLFIRFLSTTIPANACNNSTIGSLIRRSLYNLGARIFRSVGCIGILVPVGIKERVKTQPNP